MSDLTTLRAELDKLNMQCQLARDNEVRHALQRSRLETERIQVLVKLMDAQLSAVAPLSAPVSKSVNIPDAKPAAPSVAKPQGIPTVPDMIFETLRGLGDGLRPIQITNQIRREWWPEMPPDRVATVAHRLMQEGRLAKDGNRYKLLNGHCQ
jgi:hypothetical protein